MKPPRIESSPARMSERYDRDRLGYLLRAALEYGPVVELAPRTILVSGYREAFEVLTNSNRSYLSTQNFLREKVEGHIDADSVRRWMEARKVAARALSDPEALAHHETLIRQAARAMACRWASRTMNDRDLLADLETLTSESIARYCFGDRAIGRVPQRAQVMLDALLPVISSPFAVPKWLRLRPRDFQVKRALRDLESAVHVMISAPGAGGLCDALLAAGLSSHQTVQMVISTLLAAHGVPASSVLWTIVELARHPGTQDAISWADDNAERSGLVTDVVAESLRLWPPSWMAGRDVPEGADCCGWDIAAGSSVMISSWVVHRVSPSFRDHDPGSFRPERWRGLTPRRGEYLPFGAGPRWCVGQRFAQMEISCVIDEITRLLQPVLTADTVTVNARRTLTPEGFTVTFLPRPPRLPRGTLASRGTAVGAV
jgi:cytochrome P450